MQKLKPKRKLKSENTVIVLFLKIQLFDLICYISVFFAGCLTALGMDTSKKYDFIFALITFIISSFASGFFAGLKIRQNGLLVGIIYTLPMNTLVVIASLIMSDFGAGLNLILAVILLIASSAVGGIVAVNKRLRR